MHPYHLFTQLLRETVYGGTLPKRCILAMTRSAKWARTALSETCRAFFGAYRGFAKQSLGVRQFETRRHGCVVGRQVFGPRSRVVLHGRQPLAEVHVGV